MDTNEISIRGDIHFKIRFNTTHGATDLYWRVIINETEYLVRSVLCSVTTYSDASFDKTANAVKYHMAGRCNHFRIDAEHKAVFL